MEQWNALKKENARESKRPAGPKSTTQSTECKKRKENKTIVTLTKSMLRASKWNSTLEWVYLVQQPSLLYSWNSSIIEYYTTLHYITL